MQSIDECYKKVKNDCFKFINLQETKTNKFKNKNKMLKSYLIPISFWIKKDLIIFSLFLNLSFDVSCDFINFKQSLLTFL